MQIDWITVAAQIVNFLVLVWLLHRFLYGPIIRAMENREHRIASRLQEASDEREAAIAEATRYQEMQEDLNARSEAMLQEARIEAENVRRSLQKEAHEEVAELRREWEKSLTDEREEFVTEVRRQIAEAFIALARRALADLADETLEDRVANRFLSAIGDLKEKQLNSLRAASTNAGAVVTLRSTLPLATKRRRELEASVKRALARDVPVRVEENPDLMCGIELRVGGQMVRWSLDSFLDDLEVELKAIVDSGPTQSEPEAAQ